MTWRAVRSHSRTWNLEDEYGKVLAWDVPEEVANQAAAAHDLLAALEGFVNAEPLGGMDGSDVANIMPEEQERIVLLIEQARAAIAKARGHGA